MDIVVERTGEAWISLGIVLQFGSDTSEKYIVSEPFICKAIVMLKCLEFCGGKMDAQLIAGCKKHNMHLNVMVIIVLLRGVGGLLACLFELSESSKLGHGVVPPE